LALLFANTGTSFAQRGGHGGGGHGGGMAHGGGGMHSGGSFHGGMSHGGFHGEHHEGFHRGGFGFYGFYGGLYYPYSYGSYGYGGPSYYDTYSYYQPPSLYVPPATYDPAIVPGNGNNAAPAPAAANTAGVEVYVPADAEVWFDDLKTKQTGENRSFRSPALEPGRTYLYDVKARWVENGQEVVRNKTIRVQAGRTAHVDFLTQ
jgi:uncharacterized protein (TIGR03000 family)